MIVGSTWNAKIKPSEDFCLPNSPNTNSEPQNAKLSSLFAPFPAYSKIVRPIAKRRTKNANASCRPNPQRTVPCALLFLLRLDTSRTQSVRKVFRCDVLFFTSNAEQAIPTSGDRHPSGERDPRESGRPPGKQRIAQELRYLSAHDTARKIA